MTTGVCKRGGSRRRAGAWTLLLLGTPPNAFVLQALGEGSRGLTELQGIVGSPGSTLRARLKELSAAGVVAQRSSSNRRAGCSYELTSAGEEILPVIEVVERWLLESPNASHPFGGDGAKAAIGAMVEGWSSTLLRALAVGPLSVADLDSVIRTLNYPSIERRVAAMRLVGQVRACPGGGRETPYEVTDWLRRGVAPLLAAIRWEGRHGGDRGTRPTALDIEAVFLLAVPLLRLADDIYGRCRLTVEVPTGGNGDRCLAGVLSSVRDGAIASSTSRLGGDADAWASGSIVAWLATLAEGDDASLEWGGDGTLVRALVRSLHMTLYPAVGQVRPSAMQVRVDAGPHIAPTAIGVVAAKTSPGAPVTAPS